MPHYAAFHQGLYCFYKYPFRGSLCTKGLNVYLYEFHSFFRVCNTVSHFSYAPFFQAPHFLTKILESNILYDNLFIDIKSDNIEKNFLESLIRIILLLKGNFDKF